MEKVKDVLEEAKSEIERVKQLTTNEALLRADCNEKMAKLEGENAQVLLSLDEAHETDKEQLIVIALTDEPENLKKIVSAVQEKCSKAENEGKEIEDGWSSSSEIKDQVIEKLKKELEECHSSLTMLKLQNEELSFKLRLMSSEFSEPSLGQQTEDKDGEVTCLLEQLEIQKSSMAIAQNELDWERREKRTLREELNRCKELLDEYSEKQLSLMEQAAELTDELQVAHVVLERVDSKLTDKTYEGSELELELEGWRSLAERLQTQLEQSHAIRRKLEATLLTQAHVAQQPKQDAEKDELMITSNLEQHITSFNQDNVGAEENAKDDIEKASKWSEIDGDDQREQELLAGELEEAILANIMKEKNYTKLPIMLELMRSELSEAMPDQRFKEIENNVTHLMGQMEKGLWSNTHSNLQKGLEEKQALQEELNRYKEMLDESTECQLTLLEQAADNERQLIDELQEVQIVLIRVDSELTDKAIERSELEFELEVWRSTAERLQTQFQESQAIRRQLEAYVLVQGRVEEHPKQDIKKDLGISDCKQQNVMVNQGMQVGGQNTTNWNKNTLKLSDVADNERQEQELLAKELEETIFGHMMKERNYTQQSLMLNLMRSEISVAGSKEKSKEKQHSVAYLMKQLQMKNDYLSKVQADLEKEYREKLDVKEELNKYKGMLDDTSKSQLSVMQQAAHIETKLKDELLEAHTVLHRVNSQLTDKTIEGSELEFELQLWISIAEKLNVEVEESQTMRKKLEAYLLAPAEERMPKKEKNKNDQRISNIKQQIDDDDKKEQELLERELEQAILIHITKERNST